jgi:hypothetical protein
MSTSRPVSWSSWTVPVPGSAAPQPRRKSSLGWSWRLGSLFGIDIYVADPAEMLDAVIARSDGEPRCAIVAVRHGVLVGIVTPETMEWRARTGTCRPAPMPEAPGRRRMEACRTI